MSEQSGAKITRVTAADLSADSNIGRVLALSATGTVGLAGAGGADACGILVDGGRRAADAACLVVNGAARGRAGGAINEGDRLTADGNGRLVQVSAAGNIICAIALQDAANLDLFDVLVGPFAESHTNAP